MTIVEIAIVVFIIFLALLLLSYPLYRFVLWNHKRRILKKMPKNLLFNKEKEVITNGIRTRPELTGGDQEDRTAREDSLLSSQSFKPFVPGGTESRTNSLDFRESEPINREPEPINKGTNRSFKKDWANFS
jgi:hypothetical protein